MAAEPSSLFTRESMLFHQHQSMGQARLIGPPHVTALVVLIAAILGLGMAFLVNNDYTRKESVPGYLIFSVATKRVYPERSGKLQHILVSKGEQVAAGQVLAEVRSNLPRQREYGTDAINDFDLLIQHQQKARRVLLADSDNSLARLQVQQQGVSDSLLLEEELLALQLLKEARSHQLYSASLALFKDQQISRLNFSELEQGWYSAQQSTTELRATIARHQAQQRQLRLDISAHEVARDARLLPIEAETVRLTQARNNHLRDIRQAIIAPISGRVAALLHEVGETVAPGMPLMTLTPGSGHLQAQVLIPSHAIGFVSPGQPVILRYDAFPYQQFGTFHGEIIDVSRHPLTSQDRSDIPRQSPPVYLATVELASRHVKAYGSRLSLREGMTLRADVLLESRSLLEWLLEPLMIMHGRGGK